MCLFDLVPSGEGKVRYGDGCLWYKGAFVCSLCDVCADEYIVVFRMVVFRPFTSEVVIAKVKSSDEDGIRCTSLSFFLPISRLPPYRIQ